MAFKYIKDSILHWILNLIWISCREPIRRTHLNIKEQQGDIRDDFDRRAQSKHGHWTGVETRTGTGVQRERKLGENNKKYIR